MSPVKKSKDKAMRIILKVNNIISLSRLKLRELILKVDQYHIIVESRYYGERKTFGEVKWGG